MSPRRQAACVQQPGGIVGGQVPQGRHAQQLRPPGIRGPAGVRRAAPGEHHHAAQGEAEEEFVAQPALQTLAAFEGIDQEHHSGLRGDVPDSRSESLRRGSDRPAVHLDHGAPCPESLSSQPSHEGRLADSPGPVQEVNGAGSGFARQCGPEQRQLHVPADERPVARSLQHIP